MGKRKSNSLLEMASGAGALFLLLFVGLFLMLVSASCAEMSAEYMLESEDLAEQVISIPLAIAAAVVIAGMATAAFSGVSVAVSAGYRMLLGAVPNTTGALQFAGIGLLTMLISAGVGGWRLRAGYAGGEPGFVMQGTVVAAAGIIAGFMLLIPYLALAIRGGADGRPRQQKKDDDDSASEVWFTFFAVLGLVASYGTVEYVHIARAQAGVAPVPMGEFVDGSLQKDGFQGYPEKAELTLPADLEGEHSIIFIEVSPCDMLLVDDDDDEVKYKRVAKKTDDDGDTTEYARLVFKADEKRRYRLQIASTGNSCFYSVRLVKGGSQ